MNEFWPYAFGDDQEATIHLLVAQAGSSVIRERYVLAHMGSQLAQHEQETGQKITKPLLWMGGGHEQSLRAKAQTLGVELSVERSLYDREQALGDDQLTQAIGAMAVRGAYVSVNLRRASYGALPRRRLRRLWWRELCRAGARSAHR